MNEKEICIGSHCYEPESSIGANSNTPRTSYSNPKGNDDYAKYIKTKSRIIQQYILLIGVLVVYAFCVIYILVVQVPVLYVIGFGVTGMFGIADTFKQMVWKILFNENQKNPEVE